jgi:hypothetical protein
MERSQALFFYIQFGCHTRTRKCVSRPPVRQQRHPRGRDRYYAHWPIFAYADTRRVSVFFGTVRDLRPMKSDTNEHGTGRQKPTYDLGRVLGLQDARTQQMSRFLLILRLLHSSTLRTAVYICGPSTAVDPPLASLWYRLFNKIQST